MAVHLSGALPKGEHDGTAPHESRLIKNRHKSTRYLALGIVTVTGAKEKEPDWKPEPVLQFQHIEVVPEELREQADALLAKIYRARTAGDQLDMPDDEPEAPEPLALDASTLPRFRAVSTGPGVFSLQLVSSTNSLLAGRNSLPVSTYGEPPVGLFSVDDLEEGPLWSLAQAVWDEWDLGVGDDTEDEAGEPAPDEGVVDAEVVDDDGPEEPEAA